MVRINTKYVGGLRMEAVHEPSGADLVTDAPVDNHGKGASFSPTDLLATSLGSCMGTIMGIAADKHGITIDGMTIGVTKHMVADPVRRIGKIEIDITVPGNLDGESRRILEEAARGCPVCQSIHPSIEVPVRFEWATHV